MRRVLGVGLAALLLAAALVAAGGWPDGQAGAASTTCVWIKHTKRVVKHLKRHGKVKRVVHLKHYRTCRKVAVPEPTPTTTTTAPVTTGSGESPAAPTSTPEPAPNAVSITANDRTTPYEYRPSHTTVKAGQLTVQLIDAGEDEHNMEMVRVGPGEVPEGPVVVTLSAESAKASKPTSVTVQPGTYRMWCTLPHHAEKGMQTTITVVE